MKPSSKAVLMEKRDEAIEHLKIDPKNERWTWILEITLRKINELNAKKPMWRAPHGQNGIDNKSSYGSIIAHQEAK